MHIFFQNIINYPLKATFPLPSKSLFEGKDMLETLIESSDDEIFSPIKKR